MTASTRDAAVATELARTPLFARVDDVDLRALAKNAVRKSLRRGQRLFARGDKGDAIAVVVTGRLEVRRDRVVLRSLGAHASVGVSTIARVDDRGPAHSADVVAAESSDVLLLQGRHLRSHLEKRPAFALAMIGALASLVSDLSDDVEALRTDDVEARTTKKLAQLLEGRREVRITHGELANLIGATRANTSRALEALAARGVIELHRGRIARP